MAHIPRRVASIASSSRPLTMPTSNKSANVTDSSLSESALSASSGHIAESIARCRPWCHAVLDGWASIGRSAGLCSSHDCCLVDDWQGLDLDEPCLVEHGYPRAHRHGPLLKTKNISAAILHDPPPPPRAFANQQGQLRADDLPVPRIAASPEHHVADHKPAARAQPLEGCIDSHLLVGVAQVMQGVVRHDDVDRVLR